MNDTKMSLPETLPEGLNEDNALPSTPAPTPPLTLIETSPEPEVPVESPLPEESPADGAPLTDTPAVDEGDISQTQELIMLETDVKAKRETPGFLPGMLSGAILGAAVCAAVCALALRKSSSAKPIKPELVAVQGLGRREDQQDSIYMSDASFYPQQGILMCVADGMGGLSNGAMYSKTAVSAAANRFANMDKTDPRRLVAAIMQSVVASVNRVIHPNFGSGGTTMLTGIIYRGEFYYSSIGDSRICLYRDGQLFRLNRQHTYEDELLVRHVNNDLSYESAVNYEKRGALTSYVGMGSVKYVDLPHHSISLRRGDRVILMSDGVFNTLSDDELCAILSLKPKQIQKRLGEAIEGKMVRYQDNYSAAIAVIK